MIILGLTGSIAMGKSTTAGIFQSLGIPVHDSDAAVHAIYRSPDATLIEAAFPGTLIGGEIDRKTLGDYVLKDAEALKRLEKIIHPLVEAHRNQFLRQREIAGDPIVLLDIPLLYETHGEKKVDAVVVVSASSQVQKQRAFERQHMTDAKFAAILEKQLPDAEKRKKADFVIKTDRSLDDVRLQVKKLLKILQANPAAWENRRNVSHA